MSPPKTFGARWRARRHSVNEWVDNVVFVFSGLAVAWLAWLMLTERTLGGWYLVPFSIVFWLVLAYLVLPRFHRILTTIYVPDYFIGRARTSDGLLGDPINLAALGSEQQIHESMTRAGWIRADEVTLSSSRRIVSATLFKRSYDEAPVSPLLLFGRQQDLAYQQEVLGNPAKRHHVRFWRCPEGWLLPGGHHADWLAAGTFDRAVGFSLFTLQITHKIDADTDAERDHIVSTLLKSGPEIDVRVITDFSTGYHARNGGGDNIQTDGDLPVIDVSAVRIPEHGDPLGPDLDTRRAIRAEKRPISTTLGVMLMLLRVIVGVFTVAWLLSDWRHVIDTASSGFTAEQIDVADALIVIFTIIASLGIVLYLVLTILVLRGSNGARVASLGMSVALVIIAAVSYMSGQEVSLVRDLFGLPLDILVLLALSARGSRIWARRPRRAVPKPG